MMIVEKVTVFIMLVVCIISSPIKESNNIYIDGIERNKSGDIEPVYCMLQKNGTTIKCYEYKENGNLDYIFTIESINGSNHNFTIKPVEGEAIKIALLDYFRPEDLDRIQNSDELYLELNIGKANGKLHIVRIGEVTYIKTDDFPELMFAVHE